MMMDRLAQSPLRLAVGRDNKLTRKKLEYKPTKDESSVEEVKPLKSRGRKRRLLQPLSHSLSSKSNENQPSEKARKEHEEALLRRDFRTVLWMIENHDVPVGYETIGGETALLAAIGAHDTDAFHLLMQCRGISIDTPNRHGYTPLMKAIAAAAPFAEARKDSTKKAIVNKKKSKDDVVPARGGNNREDEADAFNNTMVSCVLAHNPNFHAKDLAGQTALDWAKRTRNTAAVTLLENHKQRLQYHHQDFDDRDARRSECLVMLQDHDALARGMESRLREPLLQENSLLAFVRAIPDGMTESRVAAARLDAKLLGHGDSTVAPFLDGFVLNRETRDGWTPLTKAAASGFTAALQLLLTMGADPSYESVRLKHTPLTWAAYCGHEGVVLALLHYGVSVSQQTVEGKTALMHAVANRQSKIVRHLLHAMHERSVRQASGKESFHYNEAIVMQQNSPRRVVSRWGKRPMSTASGKRKPGTEEWHDIFLELVGAQDCTGKDALSLAEELATDNAGDAVRKELQHAIQQADEHVEYVMEHRARTMATPCKYASDGCDFIAPLDLLPSHELYECTKRRILCEQCGQSIVELEKTAHDQLECVRRLVPCVNRQHGCEVLVVLGDREAHEHWHCRKRLVECRLGCGESMVYDLRYTHEAAQCVLRLVECPVDCGAPPFPANQSSKHRRKLCSKRMIKCVGGKTGTGGCAMDVPADQMDFHVVTLCEKRRVPCKWATHGCEAWIGGAVESRRHHELTECPFRVVPCRNAGCAMSGELLACFLEEHCTWQCSLEPRKCPNKCHVNELPSHLMDTHVASDAGDCAGRPTPCRLDLCGKTLRLYDTETEPDPRMLSSDVSIGDQLRLSMRGLQQRLERSTAFLTMLHQRDGQQAGNDTEDTSSDEPEFLRRGSTRSYLLQWLKPLHRQLEEDVRCVRQEKEAHARRVRVLSFDHSTQQHLLEFQYDGHSDWMDLRGREYDVELAVDASPASGQVHASALSFRCGLLPANELSRHESSDCALRLVPCPLACGQRLTAQSVAQHLAKRCNLRNAKCRLGCGGVLSFIALGEHEDTRCELRQVVCEHCHTSMPQRLLATHLNKHCPRYPRRCRFGCSAKVPSSRCDEHEATECPKRLVPCPQCAKRVWFCEQETHLIDECTLRVFGACDGGCGRVLRVNERAHHLLHDCVMRVIACPQCHESMPWKELAHHKAMLCVHREVFCRRGCGTRIEEIDVVSHEDEHCEKRIVHCPNKCGEPLSFLAVHEHVSLQCSLRVVSCPHGCGDKLFAYQVETHGKRCRQRLCECGAGSKRCARPIRLWISKRTLVRCAAHHESALLWALKTQDEDLVMYFTAGLDMDADDRGVNMEFANGFTPLATAAALGNLELAKTLLRVGADVNQESSRGRTALMEATLTSDSSMVALLLEHRASVNHVNRHGQSIVSVAESFAAAEQEGETRAKQVLALLRTQEEMERDQRELFRAIACSDYEYIANLLRFSSGEMETAHALEKQQDARQQAVKDVQRELDDRVKRLHDSIADTEAKTTQTQQLRKHVEDGKHQIATIESFQEATVADSNALEADLLAHIREITAQDIAKLLNTNTPSAEYLVLMKSICMFCGVMPRGRRNASEYTDMEWWKTAQALLMDRSLLSKLRGYRKQAISPDVMAKVRRECLRTQAFAATTRPSPSVEVDDEEQSKPVLKGDLQRMGTRPRRDALSGDLVSILATWVKGVEMEYKASSERATLADKKRRVGVTLDADERGLQNAIFEMQVATRSLPARQEELQAIHRKAETAERELAAARQRSRAHKLVQYAALNGHTPLSFACAVGNEAMVHMLLTHGACAGPSREERAACAALIQLTFRELLYRRKQRRIAGERRSRSDEAVDALVRNVAHTFLLGHYQRKLRMVQRTRRIPIHEAVYNGHPQIAEILLAQGDAKLWHKTHVFPIRVVPGSTSIVNAVSKSAEEMRKRGGWRLLPLTGMRVDADNTTAAKHNKDGVASVVDPRRLEERLAPMTIQETLGHALWKCDSATFLRDNGGWHHDVTRYTDTERFVQRSIDKLKELQATQLKEILARKNIAKKTMELKVLHSKLAGTIIARDFKGVSALLDDGAFADYETDKDGLTALMAACIDERYVDNVDGERVLAVEFLVDRPTNRPFVNFESSKGHTALSIAATYGRTLCAQALVERAADVNLATRVTRETALMVAARHGQLAFVQYLLQHKTIDVFARDHNGKTACDHAVDGGFHEVQHLLRLAMSNGTRSRVFTSASALYSVCKWGCGFMAPTAGHVLDDQSAVIADTNPLAQHESTSCPKRIVECPRGCGISTLWAESIEYHLKSECPQRPVACPQSKCGAQVAFCHLVEHNTQVCEFRMVLCECGDRMTYQKHVIHSLNQCPERFVPCPNQCLTPDTKKEVALVRFSQLKEHNQSECLHRRVRCRNGCASNALLFKDRDHHETQVCSLRRVQCKWGCDEPVLAHAQHHHEGDECLQRRLACPHKCGVIVDFLALENHTSAACSRRPTLCSLGCGRRVPLHQMEIHTASECRKRVVQCGLCGESFQEIDLPQHQTAVCSQRLTVCGLCGQGNLPNAHIQQHRSEECRMRVVQCRFNCYATQPLRAHAKRQHEQFECTFRPMFCPLGCGETIIAHTLKKHEKSCVMRIVQCSNGCGVELRERERAEHERRYCSAASRALQRGKQ